MPSNQEDYYYRYGITDLSGIPWSPENHTHPFTYTYMPIPPVNSRPLPTPPPYSPPQVLEPEVLVGPPSPYHRRQGHVRSCPQASWTPPTLTVPCPIHVNVTNHISPTTHVPVYHVQEPEQPARAIYRAPYSTTAHPSPVRPGGMSNFSRNTDTSTPFRASSTTGPRVMVREPTPRIREITPSPPPMQQYQPQEYERRRPSVAVPYAPSADGEQQFWVRDLDDSYELKTPTQIRDTCQPGSWKTGSSGFPYYVRERRETAW